MWKMRKGDGAIEITELSQEQVYLLYMSFTPEARAEWLISEEGSQSWQIMGEVNWRQFLRRARDEPVVQRGSRHEGPVVIDDLGTENDLDFETKKIQLNARQHRRFNRNLIFAILHKQKNYEFLTRDVSMGGLHLQTSLPPGVPSLLEGRLIRQQESISLKCTVIRNSPAEGCQLRIEWASNRDLLNQWLIKP